MPENERLAALAAVVDAFSPVAGSDILFATDAGELAETIRACAGTVPDRSG